MCSLNCQVRELLFWLLWFERWAAQASEQGDDEEQRDKRESCLLGTLSSVAQPKCNPIFNITSSRPHPARALRAPHLLPWEQYSHSAPER